VQNIKGENCLVVPPVDLIVRALHYLYVCKATATVIVPFWSSSQFWPILSRKYVSFVVGYQFFSGRHSLVYGRNTNSLLGSDRFFGDILAVRLQFDYWVERFVSARLIAKENKALALKQLYQILKVDIVKCDFIGRHWPKC
jgi:hypothetical protein